MLPCSQVHPHNHIVVSQLGIHVGLLGGRTSINESDDVVRQLVLIEANHFIGSVPTSSGHSPSDSSYQSSTRGPAVAVAAPLSGIRPHAIGVLSRRAEARRRNPLEAMPAACASTGLGRS